LRSMRHTAATDLAMPMHHKADYIAYSLDQCKKSINQIL